MKTQLKTQTNEVVLTLTPDQLNDIYWSVRTTKNAHLYANASTYGDLANDLEGAVSQLIRQGAKFNN